MNCQCFIVPGDVLDRFSKDEKLSKAARKVFSDTAEYEQHWRELRSLMTPSHLMAMRSLSANKALAAKPATPVYNCANGTGLPGTQIANPATSRDITVKRAFTQTKSVADFYLKVFNRNSVDNLAMTLLSSVHFGVKYNNAFWNGSQMTYGDGDGNIFIDFTGGNDVICHELTHGVTQFTAQFSYADEAGGLNESISDVFGSMFRQWSAKQNVTKADWLIGKDIMGPGAIKRGYICLRDMADPAAVHCLAPQPNHYSQYQPGMDPHYSSGIPNLAFHNAAVAVGGNSWEKTGQIWYKALTSSGPNPNMKMKDFAKLTRSLAKSMYPKTPAIAQAIDQAWKSVGL